jgi:DNA-binding transcriptional regulator YiaG
MRNDDFQALLAGIEEIHEYRHGVRHDLRATVLPAPPPPMDAGEVRRLRERIGASQAVFGMALNVGTRTVQAWESGARVPDGGTLKLLRLGEAHPDVVFGRLYGPPARPGKRRAPRKAKPAAAEDSPGMAAETSDDCHSE